MFSFVDQITALEDGEIRGRFALPPQFAAADDWLLAEAIGQLAGWLGMAQLDFQSRAVGATVGLIEFAEGRNPRGVLDLAATIERTDRRAILYRGSVSVEGAKIADMSRCIGPLMPMDLLEAPDAARARFDALRAGQPLALWQPDTEVPVYNLAIREEDSDTATIADFTVAADAALFAEHFPNQPVVPATLLIEAMARTGRAAYARVKQNPDALYEGVRQVKVRRFTKPGDSLELHAKRPAADESEVSVEARDGGERVASVRVLCRS